MKPKTLLASHHSAFTLVEVIISVVIISVVILAVMEISSRTHSSAIYLSKRNIISFQDSYFINDKINQYHKGTTNAYDMLSPVLMISEQKSKKILRTISRDITIADPIIAHTFGDTGPNTTIEKVILKDHYTSTYFRFNLSAL